MTKAALFKGIDTNSPTDGSHGGSRVLQDWELIPAHRKEEFTRLKRGQVVVLFYDWQRCSGEIEGEAVLLEFQRWPGSFSLGHKTYQAERWLVEFSDGFRTHRTIRVENYVVVI